jgi:xanthine dehydrogenase molybdenum-binding subunit
LGDTEIGQGADTVFAQMASDTLGISFDNIHVISTQDTDITPSGSGAYGSRQSYVGAAAVNKIALLLKEKILQHAARLSKKDITDLDILNNNIVQKNNKNNKINKMMSLAALATEVLYSTEQAEHIAAEGTAQVKTNAFSFGCSFVEIEVDIPLAKIKLLNMVNAHDCGKVLNPTLAAGQVHGGMSMATGFGISEQMLYDEKTGKLLNGNFLDYKLLTMMDHPRLEARFVEYFEPTSPYGNKALGEPPAVPGAAAIRNALLNATGVSINTIPLTPQRLLPAFKAAGLLASQA